jgi:DNA polymerase-3 subunit delta'
MSEFKIPLLIHTVTEEIVLSFIPFENPHNHPDVIWYNESQEPLTIDRSRFLAKEVLTKPYIAEYRVFILKNMELATIEAQQAMLKLLEEPPAHIQFILTTQYPSMILPTILSRVKLEMGEQVKNDEMKKHATQLREFQFSSLAERLNWAAKPELQENPVGTVLQLLSEQIMLLEEKPSLEISQKLRAIEQCLEFLRAKTNTKLCLEWLALHV